MHPSYRLHLSPSLYPLAQMKNYSFAPSLPLTLPSISPQIWGAPTVKISPMPTFDLVVTATMVGLANNFIDIGEAKRISAAGVKAHVFMSIFRFHRWWCPYHNRFHCLPFWKNGGQNPFHELYFWNHMIRCHLRLLNDGENQSDWDFDPFTRGTIRKTLPGIWLRNVKIARWKDSVLAHETFRKWDRKAWNIHDPL